MKRKSQIEKLAKVVGTVSFPPPPTAAYWAFTQFCSELEVVLSENELGGGWVWDEETQEFGTSWKTEAYLPSELHARFGATVKLAKPARLDPNLPLKEEIERLIRERAAFTESARFVARLLCAKELPTWVDPFAEEL